MNAPLPTLELAAAIISARGNRSQQVFATLVDTNMMTLRTWENASTSPKQYRHIVALEEQGVPIELLRACAPRRTAA